MAKELVLDVVARKNSAALVALADDFDKLRHEVDDNNKSFSEAESFSKRLDDQISKTRTQVHQLGEEFDKTGNKDVFSNLKGAQANLKSLEGIQKQLQNALPPAQELDKSFGEILRDLDNAKTRVKDLTTEFKKTKSASALTALKDAEKDLTKLDALAKDFVSHLANNKTGFLQGLKNGLTTLASDIPELIGPQGVAIGGAIVLAAGPVLTAGLSLAVGAGIIAGAAFLEKDNPKLHAAFVAIKNDAISELKGAADPLVDSLTNASNTFDRFIKSEAPNLGKAFSNAEPAISAVEKDLEFLLVPIIEQLPRVSALFTRVFSDPTVKHDISEIGDSVGDLFGTIAKNGNLAINFFQGLAFVIRPLVTILNADIVAANAFYSALEKGNDFLQKFGVGSSTLSTIFQRQGETESRLIGVTDQYGNTLTGLAADEAKAKSATDDLNQSFDDVFGQTMDVNEATLQLKQDMLGLADAVKQNGHSLDDSSAKGLANQQVLQGLAQDAERQRQAAIAAGDGTQASTDKANAAYRKQIQGAEDLAIKLGLPKDAVLAILDQYKNLAVAPNINKKVTITTYTSKVDLGTQATHHDSYGNGNAKGGIMVAAAKGAAIYAASNPPLVKFAEPETGGEAYIPRRGITRAAAMGLLNTAAGWYGASVMGAGAGGAGSIRTSVEFVGNTGDALASIIQTLLRQNKIVIKSQYVTK